MVMPVNTIMAYLGAGSTRLANVCSRARMGHTAAAEFVSLLIHRSSFGCLLLKGLRVISVVTRRVDLWDKGQSSGGLVEGQSSGIALDKYVAKERSGELPNMFKMFASLSKEKDVEIFLNLMIRKGQGKGHKLYS
ncbi:hypothetical protein Fot_24458 [Forsythia ovata]|uniref:Pentatricopeptide repeat-containing protein n=1 Tax=Forsythia ovata TaxID=205694 RepID=A0ABD1U7J1_9LAMI